MKLFSKIFAPAFLVLFFCAAINAQSAWTGNYEFDENGGRTAGGTAIFITHEIVIEETDNGLLAKITSNGYQTSVDLVCTVKEEGGKLMIYFDSYGEDNMFEKYEQGDLLLTLENKTTKGKFEMLTIWGKFQPALDKNAKSGKVYFKKKVAVS